MKFVLCILLTAIITYIIVAAIFFNYKNFVIIQLVKFQTINEEFTFTVVRGKGKDVNMMEKRFHEFKEAHPEHKNLKLYRATPINYLKIGYWIGYKANPAWQYPKLRFWSR